MIGVKKRLACLEGVPGETLLLLRKYIEVCKIWSETNRRSLEQWGAWVTAFYIWSMVPPTVKKWIKVSGILKIIFWSRLKCAKDLTCDVYGFSWSKLKLDLNLFMEKHSVRYIIENVKIIQAVELCKEEWAKLPNNYHTTDHQLLNHCCFFYAGTFHQTHSGNLLLDCRALCWY